ncbi:MAG: AraC family transcriptional regulator [Bacteroidales bacterium]|nr:AraC family transcriptional regulator [Bacteroidales bacterium]MDY2704325.1 AraC family transcriptional regulator [Alloprevotella sp.]
MYHLYIKNMVCPRCIMTVQAVMNDCGLATAKVAMGEVVLEQAPDGEQMGQMQEQLCRHGFEILKDPKEQVATSICAVVLEWVNMTSGRPKLSALLQERLAYEYSTLSKLFTEVRGCSIEQYMKRVRIERVKEELSYGERSISEIAYLLGFSSPAHLSSQFKGETGLTPREFLSLEKEAKMAQRQSLDTI